MKTIAVWRQLEMVILLVAIFVVAQKNNSKTLSEGSLASFCIDKSTEHFGVKSNVLSNVLSIETIGFDG